MNIAYSFKLGYSAAGVTLILGRHEMDMLDAMRAFVRVVETGSFSAVARERHTSQPTISKQVAWLERKLGARLLQRTTRSLSLTEEGRVFAMRAAAAFEAVDEAEASVGPRRGAPSGLVRIGCPVGVLPPSCRATPVASSRPLSPDERGTRHERRLRKSR
jgi:DNA-binding transcriptional LysR family regulator